jgi:hypothetical protein
LCEVETPYLPSEHLTERQAMSNTRTPANYGSTPTTTPTRNVPLGHPSTSTSRRTSRRVTQPKLAPPPPPGGHASILSSVSNLANTIIGAGALAFPSAFASMGLIPGIISCAFSGCTSLFGLYLLSRCATMVGRRPGEEGKKASFNEVAKLTFGRGWATRLFDVSGLCSPPLT